MRISNEAGFTGPGSDAYIKYFLYPVSQLIYYASYRYKPGGKTSAVLY